MTVLSNYPHFIKDDGLVLTRHPSGLVPDESVIDAIRDSIKHTHYFRKFAIKDRRQGPLFFLMCAKKSPKD